MNTHLRSLVGSVAVPLVLAMAVAILAVGALAGCAAEPQQPEPRPATPPAQVEDSPTTEPPQTREPAEEPIDLFDEIMSAQYATWATAPGYDARRTAEGPHGDQVQTFLNPAAEEGLAAGGAQWPTGSIIVKDIFRGGVLIQIAAMKRTPDGWYWGEWEAPGTLIVEGLAVEPCEGCHSAGTDGTLGIDLQ